jgi:hypothetical protein
VSLEERGGESGIWYEIRLQGRGGGAWITSLVDVPVHRLTKVHAVLFDKLANLRGVLVDGHDV